MIFSLLLLACALSIDALGLALAYGMRKIKIPFVPKMIIAFFSIFYAAIAMYAGAWLAKFLPQNVANMIGIIILVMIGFSVLYQGIISEEDDLDNVESDIEEVAELEESKTLINWNIKSLGLHFKLNRDAITNSSNNSKTVGWLEATYLGFALSVDAIGAGIATSMTGSFTMLAPVIIGLTQLLFIYIGLGLGKKLSCVKYINKRIIKVVPGLLILTLAAIRIFQ